MPGKVEELTDKLYKNISVRLKSRLASILTKQCKTQLIKGLAPFDRTNTSKIVDLIAVMLCRDFKLGEYIYEQMKSALGEALKDSTPVAIIPLLHESGQTDLLDIIVPSGLTNPIFPIGCINRFFEASLTQLLINNKTAIDAVVSAFSNSAAQVMPASSTEGVAVPPATQGALAAAGAPTADLDKAKGAILAFEASPLVSQPVDDLSQSGHQMPTLDTKALTYELNNQFFIPFLDTYEGPTERDDLPQQVFLRRLDRLSYLLTSSNATACVAMAYSEKDDCFVIGYNADSKNEEELVERCIKGRLSLIDQLCSDIAKDDNIRCTIGKNERILAIYKCIDDAFLSRFTQAQGVPLDNPRVNEALNNFFKGMGGLTLVDNNGQSTRLKTVRATLKAKLAKIVDVLVFRPETHNYPSLTNKIGRMFQNSLFIKPSQVAEDLKSRAAPAMHGAIPLGGYHAEQSVMWYFKKNPDRGSPRELGIAKLMCLTCKEAHAAHFRDTLVSGSGDARFPGVANVFDVSTPLKEQTNLTACMNRTDSNVSDVMSRAGSFADVRAMANNSTGQAVDDDTSNEQHRSSQLPAVSNTENIRDRIRLMRDLMERNRDALEQYRKSAHSASDLPEKTMQSPGSGKENKGNRQKGELKKKFSLAATAVAISPPPLPPSSNEVMDAPADDENNNLKCRLEHE